MTAAVPASPDATAGAAVATAALYLRVSTGRQAESDPSIPDQRRQITAYGVAKHTPHWAYSESRVLAPRTRSMNSAR
jgi:hypothetical protein